jgi:excisionase family DNA binding protein
MAEDDRTDELLTLKETADFFDVAELTVRRWIRAGRLPAAQVSPGGHIRIRRADVDDLFKIRETAP